MQVTLGKKGDYSVRAVLELTRHGGLGRRKAREIATATAIPRKYVAQILANLVQHDLLHAVAGRSGGYELARPPEQITLLEVVDAAEGELSLRTCVLRGSACAEGGVCAVHRYWVEAQEALGERLAATTFAQLAARELELEISTAPAS
jgi:Rrf2 family protein